MILWFLRIWVIVFRFLRACIVTCERSEYNIIPAYGSGSGALCLTKYISCSFTLKKRIFAITSLGSFSGICLGLGSLCAQSIMCSWCGISGSGVDIISFRKSFKSEGLTFSGIPWNFTLFLLERSSKSITFNLRFLILSSNSKCASTSSLCASVKSHILN